MDMNMKEYVNWKMSHDVKFGEAEGYPLVLENCRKNKDLKNFQIYGESVQDKGENLFNEETATAGVYLDDTGVEYESTATGLRLSDYIEVKPFMNYSLILTNATTSATNARISFYDTEQVFVSQTVHSISAGTSSTKNIRIPENISYVRISFASNVEFYEDVSPENPLEIQSVGELTTKNLFDVKTVYPDFVNDDGGITYNNTNLYKIYSTSMLSEYKENTQYTFTADYEIAGSEGNSVYPYVEYTDGTITGFWTAMGGVVTGDKSGKIKVTTSSGKTVKKIFLSYSQNRKVNVKLANMQIEEGSTATEYEPYHKYKIPVRARGKNLFNPNLRKNVWSDGLNLKYLPDEDCFVINGTVTEGHTGGIDLGRYHANLGIKVKSGKYYKNSVVFLGGSTSKVVKLYSYFGTNSTGEGISSANWEDVSFSSNVAEGYTKSVTSLPNGAYISSYWLYLHNIPGVTFNNFKFRVMLTETDATSESTSNAPIDYEPYIEPQTFDIYLDEPLRKVGGYADYVDFGKGVVVRNVGKITVTSDMVKKKNNWYYQRNWNAYQVLFSDFKSYFNQYNSGDYSNYFSPTIGGYTSASLGSNYVFQLSGGTELYIITTPASDETVEEIRAWVDEKYNEGKPLKFTLRRAEPIEEPIELPELPKTQAKTMIYEIDTNILPRNMSAKYVKKY